MTLPTSRLREVLLQECLTWIGKYYEGGGIADACHVAVREVLNLPLDNRPLRRDMFILGEWERAVIPYGELLGLTDGCDEDVRIADAVRHDLSRAMSQPDLTEVQRRQIYLECMVAGLEKWLTHTPGGLAEAARDLFVAIKTVWSTIPFV
jgi:hypothetical protein